MTDPLEGFRCTAEVYDVQRKASLYFNTEGNRCWTKAWFNGREKGEPAIEVSRSLAISFINNTFSRDQWLEQFFPKQMKICHNAVEKTRQQLLSY